MFLFYVGIDVGLSHTVYPCNRLSAAKKSSSPLFKKQNTAVPLFKVHSNNSTLLDHIQVVAAGITEIMYPLYR